MKTKFLATMLTMSISMTGWTYVAHEWGTFTSVINKEGKMIQGLHHEEEALPNFVYDLSRIEETQIDLSLIDLSLVSGITPTPIPTPPRRGGGGPPTRGFTPASMDLMPIPTFTTKITQKMETPVIYFYNDEEIDVNVKVDFPNGVISQWFPKVSKVNPSEEAKDGYAVWDVKVLKEKEAVLPETSNNSIWNPSRETAANIVQAGSKKEKLIFYRGLGDFDTPLKITQGNQTVKVENLSNQDIHGITILNHNDEKNEFVHIKLLKAQESIQVLITKENKNLRSFETYSEYLTNAKEVIVNDLVKSGLYKDESVAMVNTWEGGYFKTKGLRLLYVLPIEWTEEILPMTLNPKPKSLVRTLVGRVEILTEEDDQKILAFAKDLKNNNFTSLDVNGREMDGLGHFPEPKLRRALELNIDDETKVKINELITSMNIGF